MGIVCEAKLASTVSLLRGEAEWLALSEELNCSPLHYCLGERQTDGHYV